jgi:hypothetical protein
MNKERQAETKVDSEQMLIDTTSSPNAAKPNVGCCTSVETAMQILINNMQELQDNNFSGDIEYLQYRAIELLELEKEQILSAVTAGFGINCFQTNQTAEEYFNNTFKK